MQNPYAPQTVGKFPHSKPSATNNMIKIIKFKRKIKKLPKYLCHINNSNNNAATRKIINSRIKLHGCGRLIIKSDN